MEAPYILHMLSPLKHVSPFDANMALDAGFNTVIPYTAVELAEVRGLVQDAIFSRGPKGARRTGMFIGGKDAVLALDMLDAARKAMFPPFQISVFADPAGSFTTAAAMAAKIEKALKAQTGAGLSGCAVAVFGATGVVGFAAGVIAAANGAKVNLIGYDGPARVKSLAEGAKARFNVDLAWSDGSSEALKVEAIKNVDVILCAGRAGVQILSREQLASAGRLKVAADVNAVPPAGIEGLGAQDDGVPLEGSSGTGIGPLAIGGIKYKVEAGLFRKMIEADKPLFLDFRDAFALARDLVG
jgi:methylene-tetrahydromethanopterin dehydrogenase